MRQRLPAAGHAVLAFVLCMALVFPLFLHNGYFDLVRAKEAYFLVHLVAGAVAGVALWLLGGRTGNLHRPDRADAALLIFGAACAVSALLSPHGHVVIWGLDGRRAGLVLWLGGIAAYFLVSTLGGALPVRPFVYALLAGGSLVSVLAVASLLGMDPFRLYTFVPEALRRDFMSTIGNIDFVGGYLCLCLPAAVYGTVHSRRVGATVLYALASALCFAGLLAAGADGAWLGVVAAVLLLCCQRGFSQKHAARLLLLGGLLLATAAGTGLLHHAMDGGIHTLRGVSAVLSQPLVLVASVVCVGLGLLLRRGKAARPLHRASRWLALALGLLAVLVFGLVNLWGLRLGGRLEKLFLLGDEWGSGRGYLWKKLWSDFWRYTTPVQKLFGTGPDTALYLIGPHNETHTLLSGAAVDSAHNGYLQLLVTTGLVGLVAWLCAAWHQLRGLLRCSAPLQSALGLCSAAYLAQDFFSIDLPVVLPLLFVVMSMGRVAGRQHAAHIAPLQLEKKHILVLAIVECLMISVSLALL